MLFDCAQFIVNITITIFFCVGMTMCKLPGFKPQFVGLYPRKISTVTFSFDCGFVQILFSLVFVRCEFKQPLGYFMTEFLNVHQSSHRV